MTRSAQQSFRCVSLEPDPNTTNAEQRWLSGPWFGSSVGLRTRRLWPAPKKRHRKPVAFGRNLMRTSWTEPVGSRDTKSAKQRRCTGLGLDLLRVQLGCQRLVKCYPHALKASHGPQRPQRSQCPHGLKGLNFSTSQKWGDEIHQGHLGRHRATHKHHQQHNRTTLFGSHRRHCQRNRGLNSKLTQKRT